MIIILRAVIVVFLAMAGFYVGGPTGSAVTGGVAGAVMGLISILIEWKMRNVPIGPILAGILGLGTGLLSASLLLVPLEDVLAEEFAMISFLVSSAFGYGGLLFGISRGRNLTVRSFIQIFKGQGSEEHKKILDTSVVIDGRIADVCETGFIDGVFIVPQFILHELQHIADSADSMKRARGRRGLDILHRMQKMSQITVKIIDDDFPKIREVDAKLVALSKTLGAKVVTNDFNLNKVAELQGVSVLNVNELANAIKPVVLPGETMRIFIIKEGKEHNQGVAYLEDGTMVVVDNGKRLIGKNSEVTVTSVLQTTAGRMIFTKTKEDYERDEVKATR